VDEQGPTLCAAQSNGNLKRVLWLLRTGQSGTRLLQDGK
jgi:hypothetical protein